jgi:hypothetical protein
MSNFEVIPKPPKQTFSPSLTMSNITKLISFLALIIIISSCGNDFVERDITEYNLQQEALPDGSMVELLYTSGGPDLNKELEYYYQYIVIEKQSGDTFRVLAPYVFGVDGSENNLQYTSITSKDKGKMLTSLYLINPDLADKYKNINDIDSIPKFNINKVICHYKIFVIEVENYPTVIGFLGTSSNINDAQ